MTEMEKQIVRAMRADGLGYKKISDCTGIPESTIKSHCIKYKIQRQNTDRPACPRCPQCGKPIQQKEKGKKRRFCSDRCRREWWKAHPEKRHKKESAIYSFICENCGRRFSAYGNDHRKYCSTQCYMQARFGRKDI